MNWDCGKFSQFGSDINEIFTLRRSNISNTITLKGFDIPLLVKMLKIEIENGRNRNKNTVRYDTSIISYRIFLVLFLSFFIYILKLGYIVWTKKNIYCFKIEKRHLWLHETLQLRRDSCYNLSRALKFFIYVRPCVLQPVYHAAPKVGRKTLRK